MLFIIPSRVLSIASIMLAPTLFSPLIQAQPADDLRYLLFEATPLNDLSELPDANGANAAQEVGGAVLAQAIDGIDGQTGQPVEPALTSGELLRARTAPPADQMATIDKDIANYKKVILDLEQKGGAYEAGLSEELLALASLYQKAGDYRQAQPILNRAAYIARVNNGLFDASQVPLQQKVIENYVQLGDLMAADQQQEALFYMQQRLYGNDSPEFLSGLTYFAEWNLFAATTTIVPPSAVEDDESNKSDEKPIVDMATFQFRHLVEAQNLYDDISQIFISNPTIDQTELADAENKILFISHLFATRYVSYVSNFDAPGFSSFSSPSDGAFLRRNDFSYRTGTDILQNRIKRLQEQPVPDLHRLAKARMELADWLLLSSRRMTGLKLLEETHQQLVDASMPNAELDALFNPPLPQEIPAFLTPGYSRADLGIPEQTLLKYKGFVDLEFEVNRFGSPSSINVLDVSPDTGEEIPAHLVNYIRYSQFRPRVQDGKVKNSDTYQVRYHYSY
jgi:hypothetical protein